MLQPDLVNSGGITGVKIVADMAANCRVPICPHNVSSLDLNMEYLKSVLAPGEPWWG